MDHILGDRALRPTAGLRQQLRRIYYGTSASVSHLPVWVAKDAGLFAKKGLNVEPVQIRGGALITLEIMLYMTQSQSELNRASDV